jgi:hypothetical protein
MAENAVIPQWVKHMFIKLRNLFNISVLSCTSHDAILKLLFHKASLVLSWIITKLRNIASQATM